MTVEVYAVYLQDCTVSTQAITARILIARNASIHWITFHCPDRSAFSLADINAEQSRWFFYARKRPFISQFTRQFQGNIRIKRQAVHIATYPIFSFETVQTTRGTSRSVPPSHSQIQICQRSDWFNKQKLFWRAMHSYLNYSYSTVHVSSPIQARILFRLVQVQSAEAVVDQYWSAQMAQPERVELRGDTSFSLSLISEI
jgi:hypothetical protein